MAERFTGAAARRGDTSSSRSPWPSLKLSTTALDCRWRGAGGGGERDARCLAGAEGTSSGDALWRLEGATGAVGGSHLPELFSWWCRRRVASTALTTPPSHTSWSRTSSCRRSRRRRRGGGCGRRRSTRRACKSSTHKFKQACLSARPSFARGGSGPATSSLRRRGEGRKGRRRNCPHPLPHALCALGNWDIFLRAPCLPVRVRCLRGFPTLRVAGFNSGYMYMLRIWRLFGIISHHFYVMRVSESGHYSTTSWHLAPLFCACFA